MRLPLAGAASLVLGLYGEQRFALANYRTRQSVASRAAEATRDPRESEMAGVDVTTVYRSVIDEVITKSRPEFVQEGVDE